MVGTASERPDRLVDKDSADVYRLMLTTPPEQARQVASVLLADEHVAAASRQGLVLLSQQFGARRAPGVEMAVRSLRVGVPANRVRAVCTSFVSALKEILAGN